MTPRITVARYKHPPTSRTRFQFGYSNTNTVLLGLIAQHLRQPLAAIMRDRLFGPWE